MEGGAPKWVATQQTLPVALNSQTMPLLQKMGLADIVPLTHMLLALLSPISEDSLAIAGAATAPSRVMAGEKAS